MGRFTPAERAGFKRNQPGTGPKPGTGVIATPQPGGVSAAPGTTNFSTAMSPVSAGGGPAAGGGYATGSSNTSTTSPVLSSAIKRYEDRFTKDPTDLAIRRSTQGSMDAAALAAADQKGALSQRGILGTGAGATFLQKNVFQPAMAQAGKNAADIAAGRERDLDNLSVAGTGLVTAPDTIGIAQRQQNQSQQGQTWQQNFSVAQAQEAANQAALQRIDELYGKAASAGLAPPMAAGGQFTQAAPAKPVGPPAGSVGAGNFRSDGVGGAGGVGRGVFY